MTIDEFVKPRFYGMTYDLDSMFVEILVTIYDYKRAKPETKFEEQEKYMKHVLTCFHYCI